MKKKKLFILVVFFIANLTAQTTNTCRCQATPDKYSTFEYEYDCNGQSGSSGNVTVKINGKQVDSYEIAIEDIPCRLFY